MKKLLWLLTFCLCGSVSYGAQPSDPNTNVSSTYHQPQPIHGTVTYHIYKTSIARNLPSGQEDFYIYTPPGYDPTSSAKYPVLYLLHGWREDESSWMKVGKADLILDKLIAEGRARPMIVVMPDCYGDYKFRLFNPLEWGRPDKIDENVDLFSRMLFTEIIPRVESGYNVSKRREDRAIAGNSMGGLEALTIGLENPRKFAWVGGFSSAVQFMRPNSLATITPETTDFRLLWMSWGVSDLPLIIPGNRRVVSELEERGLSVTANVTPGRHDWPVWRYNFDQFVPLLFQRN